MAQKKPAKERRTQPGSSSTVTWLFGIGALGAVAFAGYQCGRNEGRMQGQTEGRIFEASSCARRVENAREDERANSRAAVSSVCEEPQPPYGRMLCERVEESLR